MMIQHDKANKLYFFYSSAQKKCQFDYDSKLQKFRNETR